VYSLVPVVSGYYDAEAGEGPEAGGASTDPGRCSAAGFIECPESRLFDTSSEGAGERLKRGAGHRWAATGNRARVVHLWLQSAQVMTRSGLLQASH